MKKTLVLIMAVILCLNMCACGTSEDKGQNEKGAALPQTIELTPTNFWNYFAISCSYGNFEHDTKSGIVFAWVDTILEINPVCPGSLKNVEITLKIDPPAGWSLSSSDSAHGSSNKDTGEFTVHIRLPSSGYYSETHRLGALMMSSKPYANCKIQILSVTGTFTENG